MSINHPPKGHSITVDSSTWQNIEVKAIANYTDSIVIGKEEYSEKNNCYLKNVTFSIPESECEKLYLGLQHMNSDCDPDICEYCKEGES